MKNMYDENYEDEVTKIGGTKKTREPNNTKKAYIAHCENINRCWIEELPVNGFEKDDCTKELYYITEEIEDGGMVLISNSVSVKDQCRVFKTKYEAKKWIIRTKYKFIREIDKDKKRILAGIDKVYNRE